MKNCSVTFFESAELQVSNSLFMVREKSEFYHFVCVSKDQLELLSRPISVHAGNQIS